ncbi:MAG TPA: sigma-54 dependent transcriptional regulator [Chthoniobacteraceae bacterium]|nr:sigma-54 dependent transcriptional regulator [Chthoniobacteraceae bacterium]
MTTPSREKILLVDDNPTNLQVLTDALEPEGYRILAAPSGEVALKIAARGEPDLILLDVMMSGLNGLETCRRLKADPATAEVPVIFISARGEMESVVEGFRAGGIDYITKPFHAGEVLARVENHLKNVRLTRELLDKNRELTATNERLQNEIQRREKAEAALQTADEKLTILSDREAKRWGIEGFVGQSKTIRKILQDVQRLHNFGATSVLMTGESGTGKELIARGIHYGGPRAAGPFVPVNCVAIPGELAESMFFGHVKGSFTGAVSDRKGYFELADGGTLFLDEIGDMPLALQAKLLRVLEDGIVTPVGASAGKAVDVRILAATNVDLHAKIAAGVFRQDLYFRLARFTVPTPPLRERREDVALLAAHFLNLFATEMGIKAPRLGGEALAALEAYHFPGNVRELKNIIERSLIESGGGEIQQQHLYLMPKVGGAGAPANPNKAGAVADLPLNLEEAENLLIQRALAQTNGNIAEAARLLGVHRTRIYRKIAQRVS